MIDWTKPNNIRARANAIRSEAEADKRIADMRIQFAVTLEDIAAAWEKGYEADRPEPWLLWGNKFKCPKCGAVKSEKTHFCPECGKETKE